MKKRDFKYIYKVLKPYIGKEVLGFFVIIISTILSLVNPYVIKLIIDIAIANKDIQSLIRFSAIYFVIFLLVTLLDVFQKYIFTYIRQKLLYNLRMNLDKIIMNQRITFFNEKQTGEIMSRVLNELPDVVDLFTGTLINVITQVATLVVTFVIMFILNKQITLISLLVTPFIFLLLKYYNPIFRNINLDFMQIYSKINNMLQENIANIKILKYMKSYKYAQRRFSIALHEYINKTFDNLYLTSISNSLLSFLFFVPSLVLLLYGGIRVIKGTLTIGSIVALSSYLNQLFQPIKSLSNINLDLQKSLVAFRRFREIADDDSKIDEGNKVKKKTLEKVNLENVSFKYNGKINIINNLSFEFNRGKVVRITGANGRGKTTLIDIICGLLKPQSGAVQYDGIDVDNIKMTSMKKLIGVVSQNTYLFNDTVRNNIKMGRDIEDDKIISLIYKLNFNDLLNGERLNLDSMISNNGGNLSGGQKRKITILRGLVHDPQVIILDEALTFLDDESKNNFCKCLNSIKNSKIIIIISHEDIPYIDIDYNLEVKNEMGSYKDRLSEEEQSI
ncbi:ABC transporter ATP-binding protein [Aceticella autotrophica]|uniref:ABC transporter ATP-binding protein n=1 Tax=Aceticella autotrophica TaxID=2755338 RepID=A0A975GAJ2_9THEO|nr:ABC transporter ATP-binding protein [Aceticella autotrophica]QSZ27443.1 ABC transporter ATP-binding protein [Aceticella autotrophica]